MHDRPEKTTPRRLGILVLAVLASLLVAACGGGSDQAARLLEQTFTGNHKINSGNLGFSLTVVPSGSSSLRGPITLSLGGPFQTRGTGKLPQSDFSLSLGTEGGNVSIAMVSTGTRGYVTFEGQSYELPQATFQRLESSFAQLNSTSGSKSGSGVLAKLGIQPEHWLVNPQVVGDETMGGANTTHIRAGINVPALLGDLNRFLQRASSVSSTSTAGLPSGIPARDRNQIASEIHNPSLDVWTGTADKTLRRLDLKLNLDVTGQTAALLGRSAALRLTMQYGNLNQPQTITAPATVLPYSQFQSKLKVLLADLEGSLTGSIGSGTSSGGASSGSASGSGSSGSNSNYQRYTQCIQAAAGDVAKMQKCAPLLGSG